jgi:hypothetical protein
VNLRCGHEQGGEESFCGGGTQPAANTAACGDRALAAQVGPNAVERLADIKKILGRWRAPPCSLARLLVSSVSRVFLRRNKFHLNMVKCDILSKSSSLETQ